MEQTIGLDIDLVKTPMQLLSRERLHARSSLPPRLKNPNLPWISNHLSVYCPMQIGAVIRSIREICSRRHLAIKTEQSYTQWVVRYGRFLRAFQGQSLPPEKKMGAFLTHLAKSGAAASTQNQAFNAILFLYREASPLQSYSPASASV
jgi:hypothetical protein